MGSMDLDTGRNISLRANRPLDEILYLPIGAEILFRRGQKPVFTQRYNIFENEMYKKVTDAYERHIAKEMNRQRGDNR